MKLTLLRTLLFIVLTSYSYYSFAQQDISKVDVKSLSQTEIDKAKKAFKDSGLSEEEAKNLARQRGASEEQIKDLEERLQVGKDQNEPGDTLKSANELIEEDIRFSQRKNLQTEEDQLELKSKIFGSYLFNSKNLTFEPSLNIQTPKTYEVNIGDEIIINIWGNSQNNYQLAVNLNGQIMIPDIGPVYVVGLTFEQAQNKIKKRLTSIYADMGSQNPETFAQVNMGQLRSINVNLVGEVEMPGTYTLPGTSTVFNALYLSGGPSSIGSYRNIKVIRDNKTFKNVDIYDFLLNGIAANNITLKDNDIIFIPPAEKKVEVTGEFKRNGVFEILEDEKLNKLIDYAGGFTANAFRSKVQIFRNTQYRQRIIDVKSDAYSSTLLQNGDTIKNSEIIKIFENRVSIAGAVYHPGEYEWQEGMTLYDLIVQADSLTKDAFQSRGLITRQNDDLTTSAISFDVKKIALQKESITLKPEDIVTIKSHFDIGEQPFVSISGEVISSGELPWSDDLTPADVIFMAGGFTEAADSNFIEISRRLSHQEANRLTDTLVHVFTLNASRSLKTEGSLKEFKLKPYDHISVKRAPGFREQGVVTVTGEVVYAGVYAIRNKNQRISDLINLAKGITPQAFIDGATIQRTTEEMGLENIAIDLNEILQNQGSKKDLLLKNGDILNVPEFTQTVKIIGNVNNPFSLSFEEGKSMRYYIDKTGGFDTNALKRKVYVQYANGYTASTKSFIWRKYPEVKPGCIVIVPEKPEKKGDTGRWLAITSALSSLAVAVAAVMR